MNEYKRKVVLLPFFLYNYLKSNKHREVHTMIPTINAYYAPKETLSRRIFSVIHEFQLFGGVVFQHESKDDDGVLHVINATYNIFANYRSKGKLNINSTGDVFRIPFRKNNSEHVLKGSLYQDIKCDYYRVDFDSMCKYTLDESNYDLISRLYDILDAIRVSYGKEDFHIENDIKVYFSNKVIIVADDRENYIIIPFTCPIKADDGSDSEFCFCVNWVDAYVFIKSIINLLQTKSCEMFFTESHLVNRFSVGKGFIDVVLFEGTDFTQSSSTENIDNKDYCSYVMSVSTTDYNNILYISNKLFLLEMCKELKSVTINSTSVVYDYEDYTLSYSLDVHHPIKIKGDECIILRNNPLMVTLEYLYTDFLNVFFKEKSNRLVVTDNIMIASFKC